MSFLDRTNPAGTHFVPGMSREQELQAARLEYPVLIAVLLTIPALILASIELDGAGEAVSQVLNWAIWLTFLVEAIVMFRISPDDRAYIRNNKLDLAILILTPPFLPEALQFLWVLRLLRIIDLLPVIGRFFKFNGFRYAALLAFIAAFGGGLAYAEIEEGRGVDAFDGVWWAVTTITTVGYGDQFPTSPGGRVLGMSLMLMGPVLIGLVASAVGDLITAQIRADLAEVSGATRAELGRIEAEVDEVEEDVMELSAVDRRILTALEELSLRLSRLEGGGSERQQ